MSISSLLTNIPILNGLASTQLGGPQSQMITSPTYFITDSSINPGDPGILVLTNNTNAPIFVVNAVNFSADSPIYPFPIFQIIIDGIATVLSPLTVNAAGNTATFGAFCLPIGAALKAFFPPDSPDNSGNITVQYLANSALTAVLTPN